MEKSWKIQLCNFEVGFWKEFLAYCVVSQLQCLQKKHTICYQFMTKRAFTFTTKSLINESFKDEKEHCCESPGSGRANGCKKKTLHFRSFSWYNGTFFQLKRRVLKDQTWREKIKPRIWNVLIFRQKNDFCFSLWRFQTTPHNLEKTVTLLLFSIETGDQVIN